MENVLNDFKNMLNAEIVLLRGCDNDSEIFESSYMTYSTINSNKDITRDIKMSLLHELVNSSGDLLTRYKNTINLINKYLGEL